MATAAAIRLTRDDRCQIVTTSDAALTVVTCSEEISEVLVQMTSAAGGYVQVEGAVQAAAVDTAAVELTASGSWVVTSHACGSGGNDDWSFGVARVAAGAVFRCVGSIK